MATTTLRSPGRSALLQLAWDEKIRRDRTGAVRAAWGRRLPSLVDSAARLLSKPGRPAVGSGTPIDENVAESVVPTIHFRTSIAGIRLAFSAVVSGLRSYSIGDLVGSSVGADTG